MNELISLIKEKGGSIVSTNELTPDEVMVARVEGRLYVEDSLGYVYIPPKKK